ncbi:MAG: Rrf2 family transcriptional regulator [bacterium]|nr:Rrf2 family transcriptional regulator [bacterium]
MRLTTKSHYALLALLHIARYQHEGPVTCESMCQHNNLSKKYLEHILRILKHRGYITTRRGAGGGYSFARPAHTITIAEIVRLMDGALAPVESVSTHFYARTLIEQEPGLLRVFRDIRDYIARRLERLTIADVARVPRPPVPTPTRTKQRRDSSASLLRRSR